MSLTKVEKEKEDDLAASISKTMTVDKLKEDLRLANVGFSSARKKADFVDLYISNGLHNGAKVESLKQESLKPESLKPEAKEESVKPVTSSKATKPKEELILSLIISAHGEETFR
jgi:hypothetical protein